MTDGRSIAFLDQYGTLGGGQRVLLSLVDAALGLGLRTAVLAPEGPLLDAARGAGAEARALPGLPLRQGRKGPADLLRLGLWSAALLARHAGFLARQRLLYANGPRCLPAALTASALFGARLSLHAHLPHRGAERALLRHALRRRRTLALAAPSDFCARVLAEGAAPEPKLLVVENGLSADFADLAFADRHTNRPLRELLVIGRLSPEKGQDALLEAARALPGLRFHFFGDADFADRSFAEALRRDMPENAVLHGRVDDVPRAARELGVQAGLVPSRCEEAFGLAAVEGMALSCVTAVRVSGGLAEIARATGALEFSADAEILPLLRRLSAATGAERAALARSQHAAATARYGHAAFAGRLRAHLERLMAAAREAR